MAALGLVLCAPAAQAAPVLNILKSGEAAQCDVVDFRADVGSCDSDGCALHGKASLVCGDLRLSAEQIQVHWDAHRRFRGASAAGNAILVQGTTVVRCPRITLNEDRIQGRIDDAHIEIKMAPIVYVDKDDALNGRNYAVVDGSLIRHAPEALELEDGTFTLCDCDDDVPSWRLDSPSIEIALDDRATLWWPQLRANLFGLGLVPVTPPLLPVSLPLQKRAVGFLPPVLSFLGNPLWAPTIDLPFFVPLGDSADLTLVPGWRSDWGNSPRMGARLRYTPAAKVTGEFNVEWTHDAHGGSAADYVLDSQAPNEAEIARRTLLDERVRLRWQQDARFGKNIRWLLDADWTSDDLYLGDFELGIEDSVRDYLPSRSQVTWRHGAVAASLAMDHLLSLRRSQGKDYSNITGDQLDAAHRFPALHFDVAPTALIAGFFGEGGMSYTRYGPWSNVAEVVNPDGSERPVPFSVGSAKASLGWAGQYQGVKAMSRATGAILWTEQPTTRTLLPYARVDADLALPVARRFGSLIHTVEPKLQYRAMTLGSDEPWGADPAVDLSPYDERLRTRPLHQAAAALQTTLNGSNGTEYLALALSQPVDLESMDRLASRAEARLRTSRRSWLRVWGAWDFETQEDSLEEAGMRGSMALGSLSLSGGYARWSPQAARFTRSIYALAGQQFSAQTRDWLHAATGSAALNFENVRIDYRIAALLPLPGQTEKVAPERPYITQHAGGLTYRSPCKCWDASMNIILKRTETGFEPQGGIRLSVAGFEVGS